MVKPTSHEEYLSAVPQEQRSALEDLRRMIHDAVPEAEECISYGLPAFEWRGKKLVAYGAAAHHLSFYPMSGKTVEAFQDDLSGFKTSKGTIRFTRETPLPEELVQRMLKARIAEMLEGG